MLCGLVARVSDWYVVSTVRVSSDTLHVCFYGRVFGSADRMDLLPVEPNPRGHLQKVRMSLSFSGKGYLIHFQETESSFVRIWESIISEE